MQDNAEVAEAPPEGLVRAQWLAIDIAEQTVARAGAGETEAEVMAGAEALLVRRGGVSTWSPTTVGFGEGTLSCFPTYQPGSRPLWDIDLGMIDVHPVTVDGWRGDCTRSFMRGSNPGYAAALEEIRQIHETTLAAARPGMRACDLFASFADALAPSGLVLLDRLNNIGHSLGQGSSYDLGYLDPWNTTRLWGAWAIEPFVGTHLWGVKLEDVVWFGPQGCVVIR
jgi:Xaa-Pro dipeptidase